jgi:hypothetical protein
MDTIRELPVGIQDFEDLRTGDFLYVDKTEYVYCLATQGKPCFEGKRELFEGLKIAGLEKDWIEYPAVYLDFNKFEYSDVQIAANSVMDYRFENQNLVPLLYQSGYLTIKALPRAIFR